MSKCSPVLEVTKYHVIIEMRTVSLYCWVSDVKPFYFTAPKGPYKRHLQARCKYIISIIVTQRIYRKSLCVGPEGPAVLEGLSGFNGKHRWNQYYCLEYSRAEANVRKVPSGRLIVTKKPKLLLRWKKMWTSATQITLIQRK